MAQIKDFFASTLPDKIAANKDAAAAIGAVFLFKITGEGGGTWTVNLKDSVGVTPGDDGSSDCTLECSAADWGQIQAKPDTATQLFFEGKLKVSGDVMLATKLQQILV